MDFQPKFDWYVAKQNFSTFPDYSVRINPHRLMPMSEADQADVIRRTANGIRRFSAITDKSSNRIHAGFIDGGQYAEPLSRYQQWMRASLGKHDMVTYHYTARFSAKVVER